MKYFMIESTFHQPAPVGEDDLQRLIKEHQRYLARGFAEGWILVSGPKAAGGGGVIMMKMASLDDVQDYLAADPMKMAGIQEYRAIEFKLHDCQPAIKEWFR